MKTFLDELKQFAFRGNVFDLAIGVIMGAAFQGIISSLTTNLLSPILGLFAGKNLSNLYVEILGTQLMYGAFITSVIDFIIMALVIFLIVKSVNKMAIKKTCEPAVEETPTTKECSYCISIIDINAKRCPCCTSELE